MKTTLIHEASGLRAALAGEAAKGKTIGLVPTMGALHAGHRSLIERAVSECDTTIVSIFVNPIQFGANEDLDKYPRTLEADTDLCASVGADIIFCPDAREMYPDGFSTFIDMERGGVTDILCGKTRAGHFRGVMTVVSKLFNIVRPDAAYFGEKDAQQLFIVQKMVRDLNMPVRVVPCAIVREEDGLAMSSRNQYLSQAERKAACCLNRSLAALGKSIETGERNIETLLRDARGRIASEPLADLEYYELLDEETFEGVGAGTKSAIALVAVRFPNARLIDNIRCRWGDAQ